MTLASDQPIIELKNISLSFNSKPVFQNFNFSVQPGEKVIVFGKSGTGKSTLLKLILGFSQPSQGQTIINGQKLSPQTVHSIRRQTAYIDQDVMLGEGKTQDIITEFFSFEANQTKQFSPQDLDNLLKKFSLSPKILNQDVNELSGGERQRLAIVVALLLKRPIMLLDEITSALDPASKKIVIDNLLQVDHITLLSVTHDSDWQNQPNVKVFNFEEKQWKQST
jgi:putative ABC transport system ATP-binding protein